MCPTYGHHDTSSANSTLSFDSEDIDIESTENLLAEHEKRLHRKRSFWRRNKPRFRLFLIILGIAGGILYVARFMDRCNEDRRLTLLQLFIFGYFQTCDFDLDIEMAERDSVRDWKVEELAAKVVPHALYAGYHPGMSFFVSPLSAQGKRRVFY